MTHRAVQSAALFAQAHLDEELTLARLARVANMSRYHFHRVFKEESGETPAAFVRRLRLEQAAFRLLLHDDSILDIAIDCGFANHETLTRNFRRHFGRSPRDYRQRQRFALASLHRRDGGGDAQDGYRLSALRIRTLQARAIAFKRAIGPYEQVDPNLWRELEAWANDQGLPRERVLIGVGHDAPGITAPDRLRFDACITVPDGTQPSRGVSVGQLPALQCGHDARRTVQQSAGRLLRDLRPRFRPRKVQPGRPALHRGLPRSRGGHPQGRQLHRHPPSGEGAALERESMKRIWLRLTVGALIAEMAPIVLLVALVAALGPGTTEGDQELATRLGDWVGPLGGALATFLVARWVVRGLPQAHVFWGAMLGLLVALLDVTLLVAAGSPFRWLFVASAAGRVIAGALGGHVSSRS